jgi:ketol-acid reductoisomerase
MREILAEVQNGSFAREYLLENKVGRPVFNSLRRQNQEHTTEMVGKKLRAMMPFIKDTK